MSSRLGDLVIGVATDLAPLIGGVKKATGILDSFAGGLKSVFMNATGVGLGVLGADTFAGFAGGIRDTVVESVKLAAGLEKTSTQFEVLLGNATDARDLLADVKDLGVVTGVGFKNAADEAAKLLASGVLKDQITPTLSTLSDVVMGDREKLKRAVLAYTQVKSTGYVQGDEANQLAELGVPIKKAIADFKGVPMTEYAALQKSQEISFRDLQGGLKLLTSEGGRFFGMSAKGAETLEGTFGKLEDAVTGLKTAFGQAIVEESGLKDMLKDSAKFAREMRDFVDGMRPAIRFAGDTLKGIGHVTAELVRHGPLFGEAFVVSLRQASPLLGDLLDNIVAGVKSLQDFRLDPRAVVGVAKDIGMSLGRVTDHLIRSLGDGLGGIYEQHVRPIVDALKDAAATWKKISDVLKSPADLFDQLKRDDDLAKLKAAGRIPDRETFIKGRVGADGFTDIVAKLEKASARNLTLKEIGAPDLKRDTLDNQHFLKQYVEDIKKFREMQAGNEFTYKFAPDLKQANEAKDLMMAHEDQLVNRLKRDAIPLAVKLGRGGEFKLKDVDLGKPDTSAVAPWSAERAMFNATKAFEDSLNDLVVKFEARSNPLLTDPFKGGLAGLIGGPSLLNPADLKKTREAFKLDDMPALKRPAEIKLPTAAEYGSAQAAELVARAQASQAEGIQQMILQVEQQQLAALKEIDRSIRLIPGPPPVIHLWP